MKEKIEIKHKQIHDYSLRMRTIYEVGRSLELSDDDVTLLLFASMGDLQDEDKILLSNVIKKIHLPKVSAKYNTEKLKRMIKLLNNQLKSIANDYGILKLEDKEIIRRSRNGEYVTIFGVRMIPYTLKRVIALLDRNPDYAVSILLGIYESLGKILKFLEVDKNE